MAGGNLTRDEAAARARSVRVDDYLVELDLTRGDTVFGSRTTIRFGSADPGSSTFVDLIAPLVRSVVLNGSGLDVASVFDGSRIRLDGLAARNEVVIDADCAYSRTGEGLHRFVDPVDGEVYTYSHFEPADARRMFANFEQPDLKAPYVFQVAAPADWRVWSNAAVESTSEVEGGRLWKFQVTKPISTYITAVVAGPYHVVEDSHTVTLADGSALTVPVSALCRKSLAEFFDAEAVLDVTKRGLDFYHRIFEYPYPFGKYDSAFVPEYNIGAMENPGLVTFNENYIYRSKTTDASFQSRANTILHEMAHMWFGDLVTMRWWDDLWLKESFADFMGSFALVGATRWKNAWVEFANRRKAWAYRQDQLPTTHPIVADIRDLEDAKLNFDGITYAKGASVLKQLVAYVGQEAFLEGSRRYFRDNAYGNTTLRDLLSALEETSGRDLKNWSQAWLETAGVNTLIPEIEYHENGTIKAAAVRQTAAPEYPTLRPHRIAVGCYTVNPVTGTASLAERFELDVTGELTEVPRLVGAARPDLLLLNDEDLTYAKAGFDEAALAWFADGGVAALEDPMARALVWSGLWHMTRDGVLPGRRFVDIVLRNVEAEAGIAVVQNVLAQVRTTVNRYVDPAHRPAVRERVSETVWRFLGAAAAGSDHQLAFAYNAARFADGDGDFVKLRALLSGDLAFDGLAVDQDLRWEIIDALAAGGRDDDAALADAEAAQDDTAAGRRHRAAARAGRPLPEAKAEAWHAAVDTPDQPNELIAKILAGLQQPGQEALIEPYAERYFDVLADVWAQRSIENASAIVELGYPWVLASEALLERTDAWLASDAAQAPALRRLVLEARDDAARALRARAGDRAA